MKNIAIVIQNFVQFLNIRAAIMELLQQKYLVDIYVPQTDDNTGFNEMFDDNYNRIVEIFSENRYCNVFRKYDGIKYKVLLEPYPCIKIRTKYKIKYKYGVMGAKPNLVYAKADHFIYYDALLTTSFLEYNFLSVYSRTYLVGNMKYIDFKKQNYHKSKPVLLYLPTYGNESSIEQIAGGLKKLRKDYYIIVKIHHGTSFLKNEMNRYTTIENQVDEFYDLHKELSELISISDVILTDNSGAIFDALYTNVPVACFSKNLNMNRWGEFDSIQYQLYTQGILPYTNSIDQLKTILTQAMSKKIYTKQKKWSKENLYKPQNLVYDFIKVIKMYLDDDIDPYYFKFHSAFRSKYLQMLDENRNLLIKNDNIINEYNEKIRQRDFKISEMSQKKSEMELTICSLENQIKIYENGKLYRLAKKIYEFKSKLVKNSSDDI